MEYGTAQIHDITFSNYHRELRVRELTQVAVTVQKAERARYDRLKRIMLAAGTQEFAQDVGWQGNTQKLSEYLRGKRTNCDRCRLLKDVSRQ